MISELYILPPKNDIAYHVTSASFHVTIADKQCSVEQAWPGLRRKLQQEDTGTQKVCFLVELEPVWIGAQQCVVACRLNGKAHLGLVPSLNFAQAVLG